MIHSYRPIGTLLIRPDAYAQIFKRAVHDPWFIYDGAEGPYFFEDQRLSAFEFGEVENWPVLQIEIVYCEPRNEAEENFLNCIRNGAEPKTLPEQIIVKLIYQALALGGLHCFLSGEHFFSLEDDTPANDIEHLTSHRLREFLLGVRKEMYELVSSRKDMLSKEEDEEEAHRQRMSQRDATDVETHDYPDDWSPEDWDDDTP